MYCYLLAFLMFIYVGYNVVDIFKKVDVRIYRIKGMPLGLHPNHLKVNIIQIKNHHIYISAIKGNPNMWMLQSLCLEPRTNDLRAIAPNRTKTQSFGPWVHYCNHGPIKRPYVAISSCTGKELVSHRILSSKHL